MAASTNLTPAQRSARARIAALTRWAKEDPAAAAVRGQQGLRDKFLAQVDAQFPGLPEAERQRRADCAYRAHMTRIRFGKSRHDQAVRELAELGGDVA